MAADPTLRAELPPDAPTDPLHSVGVRGTIRAWEADAPTEAKPGAPANPQAVAFAAEFRLRRLLGRGGFGEVWEALQVPLQRLVAVKRLRPDVDDGQTEDTRGSVREAFRIEAIVAANLDHPNVVPVYDFGQDSTGEPLLAMKLVRGQPWDRLLRHDFATMPVEDFLARHLDILRDVAQALAFAHAQGVVHRDLKPSQVMVGEFGEVQLADWGLAVRVGAARTPEDRAGLVLLPTPAEAPSPSGTPAYMAPEQTAGSAHAVGPHTDVYLLGATLFELLTGVPPHEGADSRQAFFHAGLGQVRDARAAAPPGRPIPEDLLALALEAMAPEPHARPRDAAAFLAAFDAVRSGANRRRTAAAILREVRDSLRDPGRGYGEWTTLVLRLADARALWPGNPEGAALEATCLAGIVQTAIDRGDFAFATAMAERLEPGAPQRMELFRAIGQARQARRIQRRFRRVLIAAGVVAAVMLIALAWWLGYRAGRG